MKRLNKMTQEEKEEYKKILFKIKNTKVSKENRGMGYPKTRAEAWGKAN